MYPCLEYQGVGFLFTIHLDYYCCFVVYNIGRRFYMTETKQDLSKIASEEKTDADNQNYEIVDDEEFEAVSKKILERNLEAYKKLAK